MRWDESQVERQHRAINKESNAGYYSPMRNCTGSCKRRRSITQFIGDSTMCIRCTRRTA